MRNSMEKYIYFRSTHHLIVNNLHHIPSQQQIRDCCEISFVVLRCPFSFFLFNQKKNLISGEKLAHTIRREILAQKTTYTHPIWFSLIDNNIIGVGHEGNNQIKNEMGGRSVYVCGLKEKLQPQQWVEYADGQETNLKSIALISNPAHLMLHAAIFSSFSSSSLYRWKFGFKITATSASVKRRRRQWRNRITTIRWVGSAHTFPEGMSWIHE